MIKIMRDRSRWCSDGVRLEATRLEGVALGDSYKLSPIINGVETPMIGRVIEVCARSCRLLAMDTKERIYSLFYRIDHYGNLSLRAYRRSEERFSGGTRR